MGNLDNALGHYTTAGTLTRQARYLPGQAKALRERGITLLKQGQYNNAISDLATALEIYETLNLLGDQVFTLTMLALAAKKAGAPDSARQYLARVSQIDSRLEEVNRQDAPGG